MILKTLERVSETMKFLKDPLYHKIKKMSRKKRMKKKRMKKKRIKKKKMRKMVQVRVKLILDPRWEQLSMK